MSCFRIYYKDGAKCMSPVLNREEYIRLRDSEQNRQADKYHMVQMNYSCLPNEDGTLKGATQASNTVGMDIDEPIDTDFLLSKREELGLLMFENSATKPNCGHIAFRRRPELSQEENLKWASDLLGVAYDKGAKDITRVFFTPADKLVFLDDGLFEPSPEPLCAPPHSPEQRGLNTCREGSEHLCEQEGERQLANSKEKVEESNAVQMSIDFPLEPAEASCLAAFDLCVSQAGLSADQMDIWGVHNWHANLMAVLSVGLPKLMSKEQLWAVVQQKLPNYSQTDDCRALISYFYENYSAGKGFMSVALRDINAKAQQMGQQAASTYLDKEQEDDRDIEALTQGWDPPELPKKIPRVLELLVGNYDPRFRQMLLLSALPVLSAHASHFRATYLNGDPVGPQLYVSVVGGSGSGKGNCSKLFKEMCANTLNDSDEQEWRKYRINAELRDQKSNAKDRPPKYHPKLRIFEGTSKSSILELQSNLGKNGMLLGLFTEADGLSGAMSTAFSNISVILRKGSEGDTHRQFYMSDSTCNTLVELNISLLMLGTVKAIMQRLFSDDNCESGLMQRFIPVIVPKTKRSFRPPRRNYLSEEEKRERDAMLMELYQKDLALGDETMLLETPMMERAIGEWFDELEELYNDGKLTEAEADLSHRCGEFMMRSAIPLIALNGEETKEIVDFCCWVGRMAHYNMCRLFGQRVQNDIASANELLNETPTVRQPGSTLLDKLPNVFTTKQMQEVREKEGQSTDVRMLLSRYQKSGKITKIKKNLFAKVAATTVESNEGDDS